MTVLNWFKWSGRQWILFLLFSVILIYVIPRDFDTQPGNFLLWLTAVVVLVYTVETQGLRFEMVRQNEIAVEPVIIASIKTREVQKIAPTTEEMLLLRNIGKGPALYITVDDAILTRELGGDSVVSHIGAIDVIEAGGEVIISPTLPREGNFSKVRQKGDPNVTLIVNYEDLGGSRRKSVIQFGDGVPRLVEHSRV